MSATVRLAVAALLLLALPAGASLQDAPLGKPAAFGGLDAGPSITVAAGAALRIRPDPRSDKLVTIDAECELQILERQGDWVRTAYRDWTGWLAPLGEAESSVPLPTAPPGSQMTFDTQIVEQAAKLASARELLDGINTDFTSIGPWPLVTDVRDVALLALLDRVAGQVPELYARRFGLTPPAPPRSDPPPVVLFAHEESYRAFADQHSDVGDLDGGGHADGTMAALFVGAGAAPEGVAGTLVHELTHLLNREHFAVTPYTWLEEGMANELGFTLIDAKGRLRAGRLGGSSWVMAQRTSSGRTMINASQSGGQAAWSLLARDWRTRRSKLTPLDQLLDLPWAAFVEGGQRSANYSLAVFFLRYLLDDTLDDRRAAFGGFLTAATRDGASNATALAVALSTTPEALRRDFERWLTAQVVASR